MTYSKNYGNVKRWYDVKAWGEGRVRDAVEKNWITEAEFKEITGKNY